MYFHKTIVALGPFYSETRHDELEIFQTSSEKWQKLAFTPDSVLMYF
jgi:hypothetical protein